MGTTGGPRVMDMAHIPQSALLTWTEYGKSGDNVKDTPQKRVSVPAVAGKDHRGSGRQRSHSSDKAVSLGVKTSSMTQSVSTHSVSRRTGGPCAQ